MATKNTKPVRMARKGKIEDLDRRFDMAYWQAQGDAARFAAAWELVVFAHRQKGRDEREPRLQRSVEAFHRLPGLVSRDRRVCRHEVYRTLLREAGAADGGEEN